MLVQEMEHFSASKARGVARTALIEIEISVASLSCARRVLYHNSRGIALHLSAASDTNVYQMRCKKSNCKFRRPNKNPMDYWSHCLKHYYYWLYCIYMPSDNEFVACVGRKPPESYGTPLLV